MMTLNNRSALCLLASFIFCLAPINLASADELKHLSTFSYTEYNKPVFIGEFHSSAGPVDTDALLTGSKPFEMRLLVESRSLSSRRFKKLWLEGVAINNPSSKLQLVNKDLARFSNLFKGRLLNGDSFQVNFTESKTTVIKLNGITLDTINNADFGPILLSSWVGEVPLATSIKDYIAQSTIDPDANSRKGALAFNKARQAVIQNWLDPAPAIVVATATTVAAVEAPVEIIAPITEKIAVKKDVIKAKSIPIPKAAPEIKVATKIKPAPQPVAKPKVVAKPPVVTKVAVAKPAPTPIVKTEPVKVPAVKPQPKPKPIEKSIAIKPVKAEAIPAVAQVIDKREEEEEENQVEETEEILELRQSYYQSLATHLQNFKTIPFAAFQRKWTGEVRLYVVIDEAGNVLSHRFLKEDRRKVFNTQAKDALKRATPFPPIPKELQEKEFSFSVPLQYRLN